MNQSSTKYVNKIAPLSLLSFLVGALFSLSSHSQQFGIVGGVIMDMSLGLLLGFCLGCESSTGFSQHTSSTVNFTLPNKWLTLIQNAERANAWTCSQTAIFLWMSATRLSSTSTLFSNSLIFCIVGSVGSRWWRLICTNMIVRDLAVCIRAEYACHQTVFDRSKDQTPTWQNLLQGSVKP